MTIDGTTNRTPTTAIADGGPAILLVEDDPAVRNLVERLLKLKGYVVYAADAGPAALEIWSERKHEIALLLTDVVMPHGVSGRELALRCQADRSDLRVLYTSGYNVELSTANGWLHDGIHFVQKPYRPEQLLESVRNALAESPTS